MVLIYHEIIVKEYGGFEECNFFHKAISALDVLAQRNEENYPDFLFLDINMSPIDSWDFLDELEKMNLDIPIISLVSTSMNPNDHTRAKNHLLVSYFHNKPITVEFLKKLEEARS